MSGLDWHPRYHRAALDGMRSLSLEERGAYNTLLDLIYDRGGPVPDDERWLAGWMGCSVRRWNAIRSALIEAGKIELIGEGRGACLTNPRAVSELENQSARRRKNAESGAKGGKSRRTADPENNKNRDLPEAIAQAKPKLETETVTEIEESPQSPPGGGLFGDLPEEPPPVDPVQAAFDHWNDLAQRYALPAAEKLTDTRRKRLEARLRDVGPEGWLRALAAIERSRFCRGMARPRSQGDRPFRADLDFVLQARSFQRLLEGSYGSDIEPLPPGGEALFVPASPWVARCRDLKRNGHWNTTDWGEKPGRAGCEVPAEILAEFGLPPTPPAVGGEVVTFPGRMTA